MKASAEFLSCSVICPVLHFQSVCRSIACCLTAAAAAAAVALCKTSHSSRSGFAAVAVYDRQHPQPTTTNTARPLVYAVLFRARCDSRFLTFLVLPRSLFGDLFLQSPGAFQSSPAEGVESRNGMKGKERKIRDSVASGDSEKRRNEENEKMSFAYLFFFEATQPNPLILCLFRRIED